MYPRISRILLALLTIGCARFGFSAVSFSQPRIELTGVAVEPAELPRDGAFTLRGRAETAGVAVGSFILRTVSRDEGRTWSEPDRTGLECVFPGLAVLSDGRLAMSYGRPGALVAFSDDGGRTWTDETIVDTTPWSGYTDVVELRPGVLLVGYGARDYIDPQTSDRSNQLRLAEVCYEATRGLSQFSRRNERLDQ